MIGLDKRAVEKLRKLRDLGTLSEPHLRLVLSMLEKYADPEWHFFTSAQRNMIDDINAIYLEPPSRKDLEMLAFMDVAIESENTSDYEKGRLRDILERNGRVPKKFAPWETKYVKEMGGSLKDRARQAAVMERLRSALDAGDVREGSEEFCRSIISQFEERRRWSPIQMEHAEKILAGNADPGD